MWRVAEPETTGLNHGGENLFIASHTQSQTLSLPPLTLVCLTYDNLEKKKVSVCFEFFFKTLK